MADHLEQDYQRTADPAGPGRYLTGTGIEIIREISRHEPPAHVLFDFDGTLSLIREGWPDVMVPMMVEMLQATGTRETPEQLHRLSLDFVMQLNGKQTIYQMMRLAEEIAKRGGTPRDPADYKRIYHDRLMQRISSRREALESARIHPDEMLVPGARHLLEQLLQRGACLYLASGTDEAYVREEVRLLQLESYFGRHVYGALDDYKAFSKAMVIDRILRANAVPGHRLLAFGDGYVEIQNAKSVGGIAIAVASDEANRSGRPDPWKRDRLIGVGADIVIGDYRESEALLAYLWPQP